mmetsp:Transcript_6403/g.18241  ORF Transcript_6403/g.18241 Transcript_6403/m.18241 type:complete len:278 (+) Transcript_6403:76-909(+)
MIHNNWRVRHAGRCNVVVCGSCCGPIAGAGLSPRLRPGPSPSSLVGVEPRLLGAAERARPDPKVERLVRAPRAKVVLAAGGPGDKFRARNLEAEGARLGGAVRLGGAAAALRREQRVLVHARRLHHRQRHRPARLPKHLGRLARRADVLGVDRNQAVAGVEGGVGGEAVRHDGRDHRRVLQRVREGHPHRRRRRRLPHDLDPRAAPLPPPPLQLQSRVGDEDGRFAQQPDADTALRVADHRRSVACRPRLVAVDCEDAIKRADDGCIRAVGAALRGE